MRERLARDPLAMDPDAVAWHQLHTFATESHTFLERLVASPLFGGVLRHDWGTVEWNRPRPDAERCAFPLGLVTVHAGGLLLEAFSEERLGELRRHACELGAGPVTADETRAFRLEHVLAHPDALFQPLQPTPRAVPTAREIAARWLTMAWPFLPREDLQGRAPHEVLGKEGDRTHLIRVLDGLPAELAGIPGFVRATILSRSVPTGTEFQIVTHWTSLDAIKGFAGANVETAVVAPVVQELMVGYDATVVHYEVEDVFEPRAADRPR